jgi:hypothetical protein
VKTRNKLVAASTTVNSLVSAEQTRESHPEQLPRFLCETRKLSSCKTSVFRSLLSKTSRAVNVETLPEVTGVTPRHDSHQQPASGFPAR